MVSDSHEAPNSLVTGAASWSALTIVPLCAIENSDSICIGCAFSRTDLPFVEYLTCPIPDLPLYEAASAASTCQLVTSPIRRRSAFPSTASPHDSCPLCWRD